MLPRRLTIAAFLLLITAVDCIAQSPELILLLDPAVKSETVEVRYMLEGKFGGFGGFVQRQPRLQELRISTLVGNIPADAIKLFIWAPGCRMAAFEIHFAKPESAQRNYPCVPLSNVTLVGNAPKKLMTPQTEVELVYLAVWACNFFGLKDCMIPTILLPTIRPHIDGSFQIEIPDFTSDPVASQSVGGAIWQVRLRERSSVTLLRPQDLTFRGFANGLRIASAYPEGLEFEEVKRDGLSPKSRDSDATPR